MQNVVPDALQRLRAADIIRMAGLTVASLGQEYSRTASFHETRRQGAQISGTLEISPTASALAAWDKSETAQKIAEKSCAVEVEIKSLSDWACRCSCDSPATVLCVHAAALLYHWLAQPAAFLLAAPDAEAHHPHALGEKLVPSGANELKTEPVLLEHGRPARPVQAGQAGQAMMVRYSADLLNILLQLGLGELRGIAREYELAANGMTKQQLAEKLVETLKQPEAVRRVAATLEKNQRQLLAALTLVGGMVADEDLRSLFERFSLGQADQLQHILLVLQGKALLFRTSMGSYTNPPSGNLGGALLDVGWYVPVEVRLSLRVSVPVTSVDVEQQSEKYGPLTLQLSEPYRILADLLLVARALDGQLSEAEDQWLPRVQTGRSSEGGSYTRAASGADRSVLMQPPDDMPSPELIAALQERLSFPASFLNFAVRFLRLLNRAQKGGAERAPRRPLDTTIRFLLGSPTEEMLKDLFELWLQKSSYSDLFELQNDGLRLCTRVAPLGIPLLRADELDVENGEARKALIALLAQTPGDQWISFPAFARFVYRLDPLFLQKRQRLFSTPHWWFEDGRRPLKPLQFSDWSRAEMLYLVHLLTGPLHWWGACDLALSAEGRLVAFRLAPLAGWLLNAYAVELPTGAEAPSVSEIIQVVSRDELLVSSCVPAWPMITILETYMQPAGVWNNRLRYRLTPAALSKALGQGLRPQRLVELLRTLPTTENEPLSQLLQQMEQWIASYGHVRIYTGVKLLETADTVVMRELSATTSLEKYSVQALHPTLHVLKKTAFESLLDELKRRGQSPLLHDEDFHGSE